MADMMTFVAGNALDLNSVVKVPVPMSASFGIWITEPETSGLPPGCWCFISATFDPPS